MLKRGRRGDNVSPDTHVRRKLRAGHIVLICLAAFIFVYLCASLISTAWNNTITTAYYEVGSDRIRSGLRIVLISDLHRKKFDETNQRLVDAIAEQEPDLICVDGDMLDGDCTDDEIEAFRFLLERLAAIAPVYFSAGNHEYTVYCDSAVMLGTEIVGMEGRSEALELFESTGAVFLESDYRDVTVNGELLRIGGFYPFAYRAVFDTDGSWEKRRAFLEDYCDTDAFRLMLSHRPNSYYAEKNYADGEVPSWDIDLVLSGHEHRGVICLPFGLGAVWTHEGLFPKHDYGRVKIGEMDMIITSGFAGNRGIPRVFNPPEIAVIDLLPEKNEP